MEISARDFDFLGRDFLTWLWFKSEERNGIVMVPGIGDIEVLFLTRLIFESGEGEFSETILCQGFRTDLKEGKAALREGKKIKEARIKLGIGSEEWEMTFKADHFRFQSMKLPSSFNLAEEETDTDARLLDRIGMAETAIGTMDHLFSFFLERRLSTQWTTEEIPRMRNWIKDNA